MTIALVGTGVSKGIAIGKARVLRDDDLEITEYALPASLIDDEVARFERALQSTARQLRAIRDRIPGDTPEDIAAFIDTHLLMLGDSALSTAPIEIIRRQRCNAEWALKLQQDALVKIFDQMDDPYLKTRRDDVEHVVKRIQHTLLTEGRGSGVVEERSNITHILLAEDLSPGDILLMHQQDIAAIVTEHGAPLSHTAILARGLGIPAVVGLKRARDFIRDGETVIVDGRNGVLLTDVDEATIAFYQDQQRSDRRAQAQLRKLKDRPAITRDGVTITLRANIELPDDLNALKRVGAEGVGLYRTEFLYLNRPVPPDEEAQLRVYRRVLKRLGGAPLTIRTLVATPEAPIRRWDCAPCATVLKSFRSSGPNCGPFSAPPPSGRSACWCLC
jgi:phosphotransferase system enzyme I (PtsI)